MTHVAQIANILQNAKWVIRVKIRKKLQTINSVICSCVAINDINDTPNILFVFWQTVCRPYEYAKNLLSLFEINFLFVIINGICFCNVSHLPYIRIYSTYLRCIHRKRAAKEGKSAIVMWFCCDKTSRRIFIVHSILCTYEESKNSIQGQKYRVSVT